MPTLAIPVESNVYYDPFEMLGEVDAAGDEILAQHIETGVVDGIGESALSATTAYDQYVKIVRWSEPTFGSARGAIEARGTAREKQAREYLEHDARSQLFEVLRQSEHVSPISSEWHHDAQELRAYGRSLIEIAQNAADVEDLHHIEAKRRAQEVREIRFVNEAFKSGKLKDNSILVTTMFPDNMDHESAKAIGYNPSKMKWLFRLYELDEDGVTVKLKNLMMSGSDWEKIQEMYNKLGMSEVFNQHVEGLVPPVYVRRDSYNTIGDFARLFDEISGDTFYGVHKQTAIPYDDLERVSAQREARLEAEISNFADQWMYIEENYTGVVKVREWRAALERTVAMIVVENPEYEDAVGKESRAYLAEARKYIAKGDFDMASDLIDNGIRTIKLGGGCGGIGMIDEDLFSVDAILDPFGLNAESEGDDGNETKSFKTNCPHCRGKTRDDPEEKQVIATIKNCKISCSNDECSASSGIDLK